jgi:hypothetical protein
MSIYSAIHCHNCPHTVVWYASPDHDRKSSVPVDKHNLWTRPRPFPPNINPINVSNDHLTFVWKYNSVPLTFNLQWSFSRAHFTRFFLLTSLILTFLFTTRLLYPSWYTERWTVLLDTWVSLFSLNLVVTSFNGVLRPLRTSLASQAPLCLSRPANDDVLYEACFPLILCAKNEQLHPKPFL